MVSQWEGLENDYQLHGIPHLTKIPRKPKSIGTELKCASDVSSGVIIKIEIQEGKEANDNKKYQNKYPFHTAVTLRLLEPWFNTGRVCIADSAFASFLTAITLLSFGFFFLGVVKTCTKEYPMAYIKNWGGLERHKGDVLLCSTDIEVTINNTKKKYDVYALGWMSKLLKTYVTTCGTTSTNEIHIVNRSKVVTNDETNVKTEVKYQKATSRPKVLVDLYSGFNKVDVHDHYRQGTLSLESNIGTKKWWHRIFYTVLGVILTDSYFLYKLECQHFASFEAMHYKDFLGKLSFLLIKLGMSKHVELRPRDKNDFPQKVFLDFSSKPLLYVCVRDTILC